MSQTRPQSAVGFLTVVDTDDQGLIGGYLMLNAAGRPLEFHCTAPVKPNRAQQILFGPTLGAYLYGEQIGQTLVAKGGLEPLVVYTDVAPVLAVREFVKAPVAWVLDAAAGSGGSDAASPAEADARPRLNGADAGPRLCHFTLGRNRLAVPEAHHRDQDEIQQRLAAHSEFDLAEPFQRIREALEEARKQSRA